MWMCLRLCRFRFRWMLLYVPLRRVSERTVSLCMCDFYAVWCWRFETLYFLTSYVIRCYVMLCYVVLCYQLYSRIDQVPNIESRPIKCKKHHPGWEVLTLNNISNTRTYNQTMLGVERLYCKRPILCLASSEILTPTPLTARRVCSVPPAFGAGGGHTHWAGLGVWGSIFWKTPGTAL